MDNIFTHFIARGEKSENNRRLAYASWFTESIPIGEFDGDERLFCEYIDYCSKLGAPINYKYLQVWLTTELRAILHETKIRVLGCESLSFDDPVSFETIYRTTVDVMSDNFNILESMESAIEDFKVEVSAYFTRRKNERLTQVLAQTFDLLNSTDNATEASEFVLDTVNAINDIYDITKLEELDVDDIENRDTMVKVTDCGLPAIDNDSGGIYTSQLIGVEAQSGTGKTRFVLGTYVYRALTVFKKNVLFITLEQKVVEIEAMLIACHMFWMYNIQVSDKMILTNSLPDDLKPLYEAAKYDLFKSGKYGKFTCRQLDLYVETFITKIRTLDKLHGPFDLVAIDYMGILESKPADYKKELTEYEIIKSGYKLFKRYVRRTNKAGIAIAQFNREGIAAGKADKEITTEMAQGGIAVYRNTDYNIAISMTETMRLQQKRRFSQPKVRSSAGFPNFIVDVRLGFLYFRQATKKVV